MSSAYSACLNVLKHLCRTVLHMGQSDPGEHPGLHYLHIHLHYSIMLANKCSIRFKHTTFSDAFFAGAKRVIFFSVE